MTQREAKEVLIRAFKALMPTQRKTLRENVEAGAKIACGENAERFWILGGG